MMKKGLTHVSSDIGVRVSPLDCTYLFVSLIYSQQSNVACTVDMKEGSIPSALVSCFKAFIKMQANFSISDLRITDCLLSEFCSSGMSVEVWAPPS